MLNICTYITFFLTSRALYGSLEQPLVRILTCAKIYFSPSSHSPPSVRQTDLRRRHRSFCQPGGSRQLLAPSVFPVCVLPRAAGRPDLLLPGRPDLLRQTPRGEAEASLPGLRRGDATSCMFTCSNLTCPHHSTHQ